MASKLLVASAPRLFTKASPKCAMRRDCSRVGIGLRRRGVSPRVMLSPKATYWVGRRPREIPSTTGTGKGAELLPVGTVTVAGAPAA